MALLAPALVPSATRTDLDILQGVWTTVAGPREARFLIARRRFTFEYVGGDLYMGHFELSPGCMDMHIDEGPEEHLGKKSLCIYQIDAGVLHWCPGRPGSNRRPSGFPDVDDPRYLSLVFRHVRRIVR